MHRFARMFLLGLIVPSALAQQSSDPELAAVRAQLERATRVLENTEAELQATRSEVELLRKRLDDLQPSSDKANLDDLRETQQLNSSRTEILDQTKVEAESKYRVKLSGMVLFNAGWNRGPVDNQDLPGYAEPQTAGHTSGSIFGSFRQTLVGLEAFGPRIAGAKTSASVDFDFFGGFPGVLDGNVLGIARLRTADIQMDWQRWNLQFAQDVPFISPLNPTSIAAIGTPSLGYSGNLWTWTPQVVLTRKWASAENYSSSLQVGVLDPLGGELPPSGASRVPQSGELSRVPALGMRQSWSWGRGSSVGVSAYFARHDYGFRRTVDSWAGLADWKLPVSDHVELSGEIYRGQALGGLWGGVGTSVVFDGDPRDSLTRAHALNTIGGWVQLKFKPWELIEFNTAFGEDNPFARDVRFSNEPNASPFLRNKTAMLNVIGRPASDVLVSLEYRHLASEQLMLPKSSAEHVNLAIGYRF